MTTTTYSGAQAVLKLERLTDEGQIEKEFIGATDGLGGAETLYTHRFPITTDAGITTDDETEVVVYKRVAGTTTWTPLDNGGGDYTITGATGVVVIASGVNDAVYQISIDYYTTETPAVGQNVSIEHTQDLTEIYQLGSVSPQEIKEGTVSIGGSIGLLFTNRSMMGTILGLSDLYKKLAAYTLYLYPNKYVNGEPYIKLSGVKFSGGTLGVEIDGPLALDVSYKGLVFETGTLSI